MNYFTPIKEPMSSGKPNKSASQTREGDWVCLNCNNLNFSFRKKCNRCKMQTREQNDNSAYSYYYYPKQYVYLAAPDTLKNSSHTATSPNSEIVLANKNEFLTPICEKENRTPEKAHRELPSVSPLVKKYNTREINRDLSSNNNSSSKSSVWGVEVRDFEEILGGSGRSEE